MDAHILSRTLPKRPFRPRPEINLGVFWPSDFDIGALCFASAEEPPEDMAYCLDGTTDGPALKITPISIGFMAAKLWARLAARGPPPTREETHEHSLLHIFDRARLRTCILGNALVYMLRALNIVVGGVDPYPKLEKLYIKLCVEAAYVCFGPAPGDRKMLLKNEDLFDPTGAAESAYYILTGVGAEVKNLAYPNPFFLTNFVFPVMHYVACPGADNDYYYIRAVYEAQDHAEGADAAVSAVLVKALSRTHIILPGRACDCLGRLRQYNTSWQESALYPYNAAYYMGSPAASVLVGGSPSPLLSVSNYIPPRDYIVAAAPK